VTDAVTREPIPDASVWLDTRRAISDQSGVYAFYELRPGTVNLTISAPGYRTATLTSALEIRLGENVLNITLLPDTFIEPPPPAN
jgi:hypothetical protein